MASEAELLAAIYADPDDLGARGVYGDLLAERGDPRGELIALQLARRTAPASPAAERRERELLRAHHEAWTGELTYWFEPIGRVFEAGLFAGGVLRPLAPTTRLDHMLRDPMWRLVRTLELGEGHEDDFVLALLDRPELTALREVRGLSQPVALALAGGRERPLTALGWRVLASVPGVLADLPALPALRELAPLIGHGHDHATWFTEAPVFERVTRVAMRPHAQLTATLERLATRTGTLHEIALVPAFETPLLADEGWQIVLARAAAPGPFTHLRARHRLSPTQSTARSFAAGLAILHRIPAPWIRDLDIEAERMPLLVGHERQQVLSAASRFYEATIRVPWDRQPAPPVGALALQLRLEGEGMLDADTVRALFPILTHQLGQRYATLRTNQNATRRPLRDKPLERTLTWASNPSTTQLVLEGEHRDVTVSLERGSGVLTAITLRVHDRSLDDIVAAMVRLVELGDFRRGRCATDLVDPNAAAFAIPELEGVPDAGWLLVFGPAFAPVLPLDRVARLASDPLLDGLQAIAAGRHVVVRLSRSPDELSPERLRAAARALRALMMPLVVRRLGYDIRERAIALLAGPAALADLAAVTDDDRALAQRFVHRKDPGLELHVVIERALDAPLLTCALQVRRDDRITARRVLTTEQRAPLAGQPALDAQLANVARRVAAEATAWFTANA